LNVDIKKNFKQKTQANITVKLQYIRDFRGLVNLALQNLRKEKNKYYKILKCTLARIQELKAVPHLDNNVTMNGGWYESDDSMIRKSKTYGLKEESESVNNSVFHVDERSMS